MPVHQLDDALGDRKPETGAAAQARGRRVGLGERLEQPVLVRALAAQGEAEAAAAEFILSNLSQRMADGLREERNDLGKLRASDIEEAMNEVVAAIRRLEEAGEITLILPQDED